MGTTIILQGIANSGKTTTLRELAKILTNKYTNFKFLEGNLEKDDFVIKIEVNNKIIVIISMGDNIDLKDKLKLVYNTYNHIDVLYGASRTKGETVKIHKNKAKIQNHNIIWTSTYKNKANLDLLNNFKAKELYNLVQEMKII